MMFVAYYLARSARRDRRGRAKPPAALGARSWKAAYDSFFEALGDGRTPRQFRHSLQDARFNFGVLLERGWIRRRRGTRRKPDRYERLHRQWTDRDDRELERLALGIRSGAAPGRRLR